VPGGQFPQSMRGKNDRISTKGILLRSQLTLFLPLAAGVLVLDQVSKAVVSATLKMHEIRPLIHGLLNLTRVHNTGAAFGLLAGQTSPLRTAFFLAVSLVAMGVVLWMLYRLPSGQKVELVALSLILGGALGNVFDRVRLGEVVDFIDVYYRSYHWPAFNVADSAISIGVILLLYRLVFAKE
jgi:signal peptidase II